MIYVIFMVFIGLCGWMLVFLILMEGMWACLVMIGKIVGNVFWFDNVNLLLFM